MLNGNKSVKVSKSKKLLLSVSCSLRLGFWCFSHRCGNAESRPGCGLQLSWGWMLQSPVCFQTHPASQQREPLRMACHTCSKAFSTAKIHFVVHWWLNSHRCVSSVKLALLFPILRTRCVTSVEPFTTQVGKWYSSVKSRIARGPMARTGTSNLSLSVTKTSVCW